MNGLQNVLFCWYVLAIATNCFITPHVLFDIKHEQIYHVTRLHEYISSLFLQLVQINIKHPATIYQDYVETRGLL